jgi:hypothetical protein
VSWEDRAEREADRFGDRPVRTGIRWGLGVIAVVVVLAVVIGVIGWIGNWFNTAAEVAGPENVKAQYHAVIEDWNAMEAAAENACGAENSKGSRQSPTLLEDPALAYKAKYRQIVVDYNRRQANIFEAKVVGPSFNEYPQRAPTLTEMQARVC